MTRGLLHGIIEDCVPLPMIYFLKMEYICLQKVNMPSTAAIGARF